ncbi:MAG: glutathionylspermidine synthase family protein [Tissierellia bacterium]|nr:glutathionylspermidine synthase family protein [Tissierellia bacterium]
MLNDNYTQEYIQILRKNEEEYAKDYRKLLEKVENSTAIIHGEPVPVTYQGLFYDGEHEAQLSRIADQILGITRKVTQEYLDNPRYRKLFQYDPRLEELILHDPGYDVPVPIGRFDLFYNGTDQYKFCEFNTDGSSAMNEDYVLSRLLFETQGMKKFKELHDYTNIDQIGTWVDTLLEMYKSYKGEEKPNIAMVDIMDLATTNEFKAFKKAFEEKGVNCEIVDIRDLVYCGGKLKYKDYEIDLIYRRFVAGEFMKIIDQVKPFVRAYMENAFMMVGSFRSQIMHSKTIFQILRDPMTSSILTPEENNFLKKTIPFTKEFKDPQDLQLVLKNKDHYIFKPKEGYASKGVFAGRDMNQEEFEEEVKKIFQQEYIFQEYYEMKPCPYVEFDHNKMKVSNFGQVVGMFLYNEKFIAPYTRIGRESLISGARDYYTAPAVRILD